MGLTLIPRGGLAGQTDRGGAEGAGHSLLGEELQLAVGRGDLTHGVAAALGEAGGRRGLVVDVDAGVGPLDWRWAGGRTEEPGKAEGRRCTNMLSASYNKAFILYS